MAFTVTIDQFEGPLDLMLHLIKDNKLDLFELDMDLLTDQYLHYLNAMESDAYWKLQVNIWQSWLV